MIKKHFFWITIAGSLMTSCASILNPRQQNVTVYTQSQDTKVYVDGILTGTGKEVTFEIKRNLRERQIHIELDSMRQQYYALIPTKKSPLYFFSFIPFGAMVLPMLFDNSPNAYNYPKEIQTGAGVPELYISTDHQFVELNEFVLNNNGSNMLSRTVQYKQFVKDTTFLIGATSYQEDLLDVGKERWALGIKEVLKKYGLADSSVSMFKNSNNTLNVNATVSYLKSTTVTRSFEMAYMQVSFNVAEVKILWELKDAYGNLIYADIISSVSDSFIRAEELAINDAIANGLKTFLAVAQERGYLKLNDIKKAVLPPAAASKTKVGQQNKATSIAETVKACVTIKTPDGHGSGFFIGDAGEILTNYHVIKGTDSLQVILNDGTKLKASVLKFDMKNDLALLKIEHIGHRVISLSETVPGDLGEEIYAIGTPTSLELTQSISRGIVSGERNIENERILQIDAKVNGGNSGGPLISKKGNLMGIVSAKLVGRGVEGIGFAIAIETAIQSFGLTVQ